MKPTLFIHSNKKQLLGAKLSAYSMKKHSNTPDAFDVKIILVEDYPQLTSRQGEKYLRKGAFVEWDNDDLQSFTLARFLPPMLMGYEGRAVVVDPDVFAVAGADVMDLFNRDMNGKSICCSRYMRNEQVTHKTSVMLLDCEKLSHWDWDKDINDLFEGKRDYRDWMSLWLESPSTIGQLEDFWNHYDYLDETTKFIHFTKRSTQPWKTGLKIDFKHDQVPFYHKILPSSLLNFGRSILNKPKIPSHYVKNTNDNQVKFFLGLMELALNEGAIDSELIQNEINLGHVRKDLLDITGSCD